MQTKKRARKGASAFLNERGYPTTPNTLTKLASTGGGPIYRLFGNRALYEDDDLLAWAESKLSAPRRSTSEVE
jgi:hypothetical protein